MVSATYTQLMQSKYFHPAFNSAIFDGPFRIYFAQSQEPQALKVYFQLQQAFARDFHRAKEAHKSNHKNVLIMIYPNSDSFQMSFEGASQHSILEEFGSDSVLGICGPIEDEQILALLEPVVQEIRTWPMGESRLASL